jgi:hypothetical protein
MLSLDDIRKVEIKVDGEWVSAQFAQIEAGDTFRLFEPDGTPVHMKIDGLTITGESEFTAGDFPNVILGVMNGVSGDRPDIVMLTSNKPTDAGLEYIDVPNLTQRTDPER